MNKGLLFLINVISCMSFARVVTLPKNVRCIKGFELNSEKRVSSYPYISGDTFRAFCDHVFDETKTFLDIDAINAGDTLFLVADFFPYFFAEVYPKIKRPFILVSHNRDASVPGKFAKYLDDEKIIAWFSVNIDKGHPKLHPLPIGLANAYWPHGKAALVEKTLEKNIIKSQLLCASYISITHKSRKDLYRYFRKLNFCYFPGKKKFEEYLGDLAASQFVLSPRGNGIDCHRTWEALMCGAIPIVPSTTINKVYEDLPVLIVDDWRSIDQAFLMQKWQSYKKTDFLMEKLYADYWFTQINYCKRHRRID